MQSKIVPFFLYLFLIAGCSTQNSSSQLHALFDEEWAFRLQEDPLFATTVGFHDYDDRLPAVTEADQTRRNEYYRDLMERLQQVDRASLSRTDQINYDIFKRQIWDAIESYKFKSYLIPFTSDDGFHIAFARLPNQVPHATAKDYENYIKRLNAFPAYVDEHIDLLRQGIGVGMTMPRVVLEGYDVTMKTHIVKNAAKSVFYKPFEKIPSTLPADEQDRLRTLGEKAILDGVVVGYQKLLDFMVDEYVPKARTSIGASDLPNGREYYAQRVKYFT
ncbi:MAG: DUF885 family protein, partial [bacterium]